MNYINLDGIGEKISKLRKEQGVTIRELSEYTGYSVGFLSNLETGKNSPTVESLQKVAEALRTDIIEILTKEKQHHTVIRKHERSVFDHPQTPVPGSVHRDRGRPDHRGGGQCLYPGRGRFDLYSGEIGTQNL